MIEQIPIQADNEWREQKLKSSASSVCYHGPPDNPTHLDPLFAIRVVCYHTFLRLCFVSIYLKDKSFLVLLS